MLRLLASFLTACVVSAAMLVVAVQLWGGFERATGEDEIAVEAHPLDLLVGYDSLDVAELLGEPRRRLPELEAPPPMLSRCRRPRQSSASGAASCRWKSRWMPADGRWMPGCSRPPPQASTKTTPWRRCWASATRPASPAPGYGSWISPSARMPRADLPAAPERQPTSGLSA